MLKLASYHDQLQQFPVNHASCHAKTLQIAVVHLPEIDQTNSSIPSFALNSKWWNAQIQNGQKAHTITQVCSDCFGSRKKVRQHLNRNTSLSHLHIQPKHSETSEERLPLVPTKSGLWERWSFNKHRQKTML